MKINPVTPVYKIKPVAPMKVRYISLPVRAIEYSPMDNQLAPNWLIALLAAGLVALGMLLIGIYG